LRRLAIFLVLFYAVAAHGQTYPAFEQGRAAFKQGKYSHAISEFSKAMRAGMDSAALYYNLGVCHYKLGQYAQAEVTFQRAARFPDMAPLAYYNLGLIKQKQGDKLFAEHWWQMAYNDSNNSKLKNLARRSLDKLDRKKPDRWSGYVSAAYGYDDNVTLDNDTIIKVSARSDQFWEVYGYLRGVLSGKATNGVLLKASAFGDFYNKLSRYDYTNFNTGLYKTFPSGKWRNEAGAYVTYSTLNGNGYLRSANLSLVTRKRLSKTTRLRFKLRLRNIESVNNLYNYLDGTSHDFRAESRWRLGNKSALRVYYEIQLNDRNDRHGITSGKETFSSLSPTRHRLRADLTFKMASTWYGRIAAEYRSSRYDEANTEINNTKANNTEVIQREDNRGRRLIELRKRFGKSTDLTLQRTYSDNSSNISRFSYTRNISMLQLQYRF